MLQGHLDMVCERDPSSPNDPAEGRIALVRDGDWLTADGTTLGADDGVAIAAMMALVEDESLPHGPLELLMTVAEEVGLEGANALDGSLLTGSTLINLDSEEDGPLTVGCAGSTDTWIRIEAPREAAARGRGHALGRSRERRAAAATRASEIALGRSNAIKVLGRALREAYASRAVPARLAGRRQEPQRDPARRGRGLLGRGRPGACVPGRGRAARPRRSETPTRRPTRASRSTSSPPTTPPTPGRKRQRPRSSMSIALVPTGPLAMSPDFDDLVETSTSLGEAITEGDRLTLHSLSRSSNDAAMPEVIATLDAAARLAGGTLEVKHNYNGWRPDLDSEVLAVARRCYERLFGEPPVVTAIHAGLETAVIGGKVAGLDMLAIGPQIEFPHSPDERVSIPTVERFWQLLVGVVDELSDPGK